MRSEAWKNKNGLQCNRFVDQWCRNALNLQVFPLRNHIGKILFLNPSERLPHFRQTPKCGTQTKKQPTHSTNSQKHPPALKHCPQRRQTVVCCARRSQPRTEQTHHQTHQIRPGKALPCRYPPTNLDRPSRNPIANPLPPSCHTLPP